MTQNNPYEELRRAVSISVYATHYDRRVSCGEAENIILSAIDAYIEAKAGEMLSKKYTGNIGDSITRNVNFQIDIDVAILRNK